MSNFQSCPSRPISVVISDDHPIIRSGVRELLRGSEISVVAEASTPAETLQVVMSHRPDLLLIDVRLAGGEAFEVLEELKRRLPTMRMIVLSAFDNPTYVVRSLIYGADDYVLKDCQRESLIEAIQAAVWRGEPPRQSRLRAAKDNLYGVPNGRREPLPLTNREWQVLRHLALGLTNAEIGLSLNIAVHTVKEHVQRILRKLKLKHRTEAGVWALRQEILVERSAERATCEQLDTQA